MNKPNTPYPLTWPNEKPRTKSESRETARFSTRQGGSYTKQLTVHQSISRLMNEISLFTKVGQSYRIDESEVIISTNLRTRLDGGVIARQVKPEDPGVAVYFELDGEPYCFPCDKWDRIADNIAAIASHIGALRGIERWGVGDLKQAFSGWSALPSPGSVIVTESWRNVLDAHDCETLEEVAKQFKIMRSKHHPDKGGDSTRFDIIQRAFQMAKDELQ